MVDFLIAILSFAFFGYFMVCVFSLMITDTIPLPIFGKTKKIRQLKKELKRARISEYTCRDYDTKKIYAKRIVEMERIIQLEIDK